jgi:hypothetical protein
MAHLSVTAQEGGRSGQAPSCSQNAHDKNVLAWGKRRVSARRGRAGEKVAQLRATLATPLKNDEESLEEYAQRAASEGMERAPCRPPARGTRAVEDPSAPIPEEIASELRRINYEAVVAWERSRAVEDQASTP